MKYFPAIKNKEKINGVIYKNNGRLVGEHKPA